MDDRALSKTLSFLLRHRPDARGLTLDAAGWVDVSALLTALACEGVSREQLERVVHESDKQRFAFDAPRLRIRANQGHSVEVALGYAPCAPPATLYHGTVERQLAAIQREGLQRRSRHHVHLSASEETARNVGARRGQAVVLTIDASAMHAAGRVFYRSANGVWLTDAVPPEFLQLPKS